jgi:hypothetical protein
METQEKEKTKNEKRIQNVKILSALSQTLRKAKTNDSQTINELLEKFYSEDLPAGTKFQSFRQWKKESKSVKKGEHGFLFWGRPLNPEDAENEKFYPLCYLFASHQVEDSKKQYN